MKPDSDFGGIDNITQKKDAKGCDTMPGKQHEIWFHEKLVNKGDTNDFRANRAEDWTRLQVLDGNTFKPAMGQGFSGMPSSEQMENLYKLAEQGKLVYFAHGEEIPFAATTDGFVKINMNPVKPEMPVEQGVSRNKYETELQRYPRRLEIYEAAVKVLNKLGEGFHEALESYNNTRNMEAEQTEEKSREATIQNAHELHRLENTDRFINDVFGPRPVASPGYFFDTAQNGTNDFVFSYDTFDRQFAPNGYDLPEDSKLTAQEVATINFAMTGASEFVANVYKEQLGAGEKYAKGEAEGGFQMLVTGCFGKARIAQRQAKNEILKETFKLGKQMVEQYNSGSSEPLGKNLADCVRNIKAVCAGYSWGNLSQDMVAGARVIGRIQELFDKHEDIKQAANLTEKEQQFMRGYVQLGKAYEQYLKSMIKFSDATVRAEAQRAKDENKPVEAEDRMKARLARDKNMRREAEVKEKVEVLADAVLRRLVEMEFLADMAALEADLDFRKERDDAAARDMEDSRYKTAWMNEHPEASTAEIDQHMMANDKGIHSTLLSNRDLDHEIIHAMAKKGMLEKMRSDLMQNPAIRAAAAKEPFEFSGKELEKSNKLDELVAQTEATKKSWKTSEADKLAWFESMKATLSGNKPENWLNPNAASDNNRLMIGYIRYDAEKGTNEVNMIGLEAILEGGVKALENPDQETLDILHEAAANGNLYYYDVGKDMPIRVGAEGAQATTQRTEPTLWQRFANTITFGWAYAEIFNPTPNSTEAAIMAARASRSAAAQNEAQQRAQEIKRAKKIAEQKAEPDQKQNQKQKQKQNEEKEVDPNQMLGRKLAEYNKENVDAAIGRFALTDEKYMPAAGKNSMGLTKEEVGVLAAIACGSGELSFQDANSGATKHNDPDQYYSKIISVRYAKGDALESKGAKSFRALARRAVKNALENDNMEKLGKLLADGLTQNNKFLAKQTDLSDYYTVYAELGGKLLNIVEKNEQLKQAFNKHLGKNTNQINMAKAAKNISDLRVKVLPLKEKLMKDFTKYQKSHMEGVKDKPLHVSTNEEIATICQLCMIQHSMKMRTFDLATCDYNNPNTVDEINASMRSNKVLDIFRTKTDYREVLLDDVYRMAVLYSDAINLEKAPVANPKQMQNTLNKQNEQEAQKQQEVPNIGP